MRLPMRDCPGLLLSPCTSPCSPSPSTGHIHPASPPHAVLDLCIHHLPHAAALQPAGLTRDGTNCPALQKLATGPVQLLVATWIQSGVSRGCSPPRRLCMGSSHSSYTGGSGCPRCRGEPGTRWAMLIPCCMNARGIILGLGATCGCANQPLCPSSWPPASTSSQPCFDRLMLAATVPGPVD